MAFGSLGFMFLFYLIPPLCSIRMSPFSSSSLRVGINYGNAVLASRDRDGNPQGIAVDLAHELARRVDLPLEFVTYEAAGRMADGAKAGAWDVAFLAAEPERSAEIDFSAPYLEMDTTYLVTEDSALRHVDEVDQEGTRIAVSAKSAYDLFLSRNLKHATLVRAPGPEASVHLFFSQHLDALAGVKPLLIDIARSHAGARLLEGRFTVVRQAVGTPKGREAAARYLAEFVTDIKASGLVARLIEKHGVRGVSVAL
jgi:polar amino acid transport system substrate-binding protein